MIKIKKILSKHFPELAAAYHSFQFSREMKKVPVCKTPFGFLLAGHSRMQLGTFEPDETKLMQNLAPELDVFIDVGANIGYFVCLMRSLNKYVVAIEPVKHNLDYVFTNLKMNNWHDVEVFPVGLAEQPNILEIFGGGTGASLISNWSGTSTVLRSTIPINTLDNIVGQRFSGKRLLIKIDVEGVEYEVIKGAINTLKMYPAPKWLVEICLTEHHPQKCNPNYVKIFETFFEQGYSACVADNTMRPVTLSDVKHWYEKRERNFGGINYIFEKKL